jgi:hypothetical protein
MTYQESIPIAKSLAEQALSRGFDAEAFIILHMLNNEESDEAPDSEVDNKIQRMYNLFLLYVTKHDLSVLDEFLDTNYRMIDELYHSTYKQEERELFRQYTKNILTLNGS